MTLAGLYLLFRFYKRQKKTAKSEATHLITATQPERSLLLKRLVFMLLVLFPMVIPSDWTQDVPQRYGKRHYGMRHTAIYPRIAQSKNISSPEDTIEKTIFKGKDEAQMNNQ
jgi:hypothetical protein